MSAMKNEIDNSSLSSDPVYPDLREYYSRLTPFISLSIYTASVLTILNISIFATTISRARRGLTNFLYIPTFILCSFYPIVSLAALITILFPKSWLICNTVMHLCFVVGVIVFHNLCYRYTHSEAGFLKAIRDQEALVLQSNPCCCCCSYLPKFVPNKKRLFVVKCLIWQLPVIHCTLLAALNITYLSDPEAYHNVMIYFVPFIVTSTLIGLWGLNITCKMISKLYPDYKLIKKMIYLRLIIILCKLQYHILSVQFNSFDFGGVYPISNTIIKQTWINVLIVVEMTLVSIFVQKAYTEPVLYRSKRTTQVRISYQSFSYHPIEESAV